MPMKSLSADALRQYREDGYYAPVRAITAAEAAATRRHLEAYEQHFGGLRGPLRHKTHLLFTWLNDLIRHPGILDPVEDVIGPNILCWGTSFFIKDGRDPSFVSWHQDSTYWGLEPPDIVTAWIAISESTLENGAMRVIPGSHRGDQMPHRDTFARDNLLSRGQEVAVEVDGASAVDLELQPGEMSLHHVRLIHGSEPNPSARRRIGFAIRYLPTHVRQTVGERDYATLVRGVDTYGNFEPEQRPEADMTEAARAFHARVTGATDQVLMRETRPVM
jgi:non-haem Fe2+, alpha-ketoglutarate-dependent halogenase